MIYTKQLKHTCRHLWYKSATWMGFVRAILSWLCHAAACTEVKSHIRGYNWFWRRNNKVCVCGYVSLQSVSRMDISNKLPGKIFLPHIIMIILWHLAACLLEALNVNCSFYDNWLCTEVTLSQWPWLKWLIQSNSSLCLWLDQVVCGWWYVWTKL